MRQANRLSLETSPYLLQHAHNPVDWYAWGEEAFAAAREQDKPIFLSVGYSTCYWCHVMERESFENEKIAAAMNSEFIAIKVDREERPDVDQLYMTAVQLLTHSGGWPMSVFLTPDLKPFYGGTYFPPSDLHGRPGFPTVLRAMADAWKNRRDEVTRAGESMVMAMEKYSLPRAPEVALMIDAAFVDTQIGRAISDYDRAHGGFGGAPKFPRETLLELLLAYCAQEPVHTPAKDGIRKMLAHTLEMMARGGIRDQLGGGFHRYSTDGKWLIPHFEIMLYDNALLLGIYARAAVDLKRQELASVARGIADFILREMTGPDGEFYTAFDAEVDGREGGSYLWTRQQIAQVLSEAEAAFFNRAYGVDRGPNFEDPHHGTGTPEANVLYLPERLGELAEQLGAKREDVERDLASARAKLLAARKQRKQPLLDTKVITSWNAMMIRGLAIAGDLLAEPRYLDAAKRGMRFLMSRHRTAEDGLWHSSRDGVARIAGFVDDYASTLHALVELGRITGEQEWLDQASRVRGQMLRRFSSPAGALYFTDAGEGEQMVRQVVAADSPLPSGNSVAGVALLEMGEKELPEKIIASFADSLDSHGEALGTMVMASMEYVRRYGAIEVPASSTNPLLDVREQMADAVTATADLVGEHEAQLTIRVADGYHINGSEVPDGLCPTRVLAEGVDADVEYPGTARVLPLPDGGTVGVYEGNVIMRVMARSPLRGKQLVVQFQPCSEVACLEKRTLIVHL